MKLLSDLSRITEDDAEEFGIDWTERDGFSVRKMRQPQLWGADAAKPLFKQGMRPQPKLVRIAKHLISGVFYKEICRLEKASSNTVAKLRKALIAEGINVKRNVHGKTAHDLIGQKFGRLEV